MGEIVLPTHCPTCGRELEHRASVEYDPKVKASFLLFHKDDKTPICREATLDTEQ